MRHNPKVDSCYNKDFVHKPIMWREIIDTVEKFCGSAGGVIVDCTLGEGGHSEIFLNHFENVKVVAFERDGEILERALGRLSSFGERFRAINDNFSNMEEYLEPESVNCVLYDFGISSYHLDLAGRGFSFSGDEPLDMRLDGSGLSARDVVNGYSEGELRRVIKEYGEERWFPVIAKVIVSERSASSIETTGELARIVLKAIPKKFHVRNIHPATRVFQALRIEVNGELHAIAKGLLGGFNSLVAGGVMMAMSFHSLEDRLVKRFYKRMKDGCLCGNDGKFCLCTGGAFGEILTRKPLMAREDEVLFNNRSRSAKLRLLKKIRSIDGEFK